jgi:hypothetical protein
MMKMLRREHPLFKYRNGTLREVGSTGSTSEKATLQGRNAKGFAKMNGPFLGSRFALDRCSRFYFIS